MAKFTVEYEVTCPVCNAGQVVKIGKRNGQQRFKCKQCGKKFRHGKVNGKKFDAEQIGGAIRHYYTGLSYTQVAKGMRDLYDIEPSTDTLYNLVEQYTHKASCMLEGLKAHIGDTWVADEMWVDVGGRTMYHWNIMDAKSRYLLASHLDEHRNAEGARAVIRKALKASHRQPKEIKTDGLTSYGKPIRELMPGTKHTVTKGIQHFINNNLSERMQNTYRSRTKTLRGLHSKDTGQRFLDGYTITYNFFRKHKGLKRQIPADVAKVEAPFREWADVVRANVDVPKLERTPTPRARKGVANKKVRRTELRKRHREATIRTRAQGKVDGRQMRLLLVEQDGTTKAKPSLSATRATTMPKDHQSKLKPIKTNAKVDAPKPVLPKPLASKPKIKQHSLLPLMDPPRFTRPKPAGTRR